MQILSPIYNNIIYTKKNKFCNAIQLRYIDYIGLSTLMVLVSVDTDFEWQRYNSNMIYLYSARYKMAQDRGV